MFSQSKNTCLQRFNDCTHNAHNTLINKNDSLIRNTTRKQKPYDRLSANHCTQKCRICEQHSDTSISAIAYRCSIRQLIKLQYAQTRNTNTHAHTHTHTNTRIFVIVPNNQTTKKHRESIIAEVPAPIKYHREPKRVNRCDPCRPH
jgi:hypothetical protein